MIRYILADDHKIFRQGLKLILADDPQLTCIGEAANGMELLELLKNRNPDVILLDMKMPEMDGFEAITLIRKNNADIRIVVITMYEDENFVLRFMEAGANGYLVKNAEPDEIRNAIHTAHEEGYYFNNRVSKVMLKKVLQKSQSVSHTVKEVSLSEREREIMQLICKEYTATEIAEKLYLSHRTVEGIKSALLEKVGVRSTAGLIVYAIKAGIAD